jgi:methylmalonyl-CoA mutase
MTAATPDQQIPRWDLSEIESLQTYTVKNPVRVLTSTGLFDGHDASINIMRRLVQARGCEVIHLGHNRSALEVAKAALEEDVQAVALSSYQGGHVEYFKYVRKLLDDGGGQHVKIYGGGGGVIVPREIRDLENSGISRIYSPEDGQKVGLQGIIGHLVKGADFELNTTVGRGCSALKLARSLTLIENSSLKGDFSESVKGMQQSDSDWTERRATHTTPVIGITGTGGAGKSSLTDEILNRFLWDHSDIRIAVLCIDPSKKKTGGALLGDRIRMNSAVDSRIFLRSFATRGSGKEVSSMTGESIRLLKETRKFDLILVETSGIGQGDSAILGMVDLSLYVMTAEYGAQTQLEKIDMLDFADLIAINKFERARSEDARRDVCEILRRGRFKGVRQSEYPVYGTIASRFSDDGVSGLYQDLCTRLNNLSVSKDKLFNPSSGRKYARVSTSRDSLIPSDRVQYLSEISRVVRSYHSETEQMVSICYKMEALEETAKYLPSNELSSCLKETCEELGSENLALLKHFEEAKKGYSQPDYHYSVRGQDVSVKPRFTSLSHLDLPKVSLPNYRSKTETLSYMRREGIPGFFPFTGGVFPFRRQGEDPQRMFAGEGGPKRTNQRFIYLSKDSDAKRLSTAFDSVTLYGAEPDERPDIYGKVGESGVSIATLDDMKELYRGFDLCSPSTSVSMTINGPAPIILAFFFNTAYEQSLEKFRKESGKNPSNEESSRIFDQTLSVVRGTVQADILKEDQAQNTCIFSIEFALKMMGDMEEYFVRKKIKNYYSVSISGYHIAEAGANPITQLAFTLANGFTYVEYYLARGMSIDDFARNLSFFFSNGIDPEYAVLGRVARRIWAIALRDRYGASEVNQKLKYHIQTSGRSLHAQEIDFNDVRTTLQALMALYDNCNSLHTNAYDEAITTPTEESVRRALAIQMIINKEYGPNKCENINQGSYFLEELTDLVEEAVLAEFDRLSSRGGVLGAMETQYQRSKIQEESLHYESLKDSGELPIIGVNTFLNPRPATSSGDTIQLARATYEEKNDQLKRLNEFKNAAGGQTKHALDRLASVVLSGGNIFEELISTVRFASLGEITETLYRVGGQYRRAL